MDPVTLSIGALAVAFVVKAAEKAGETVVEGFPSAVGKIRAWLRKRFAQPDEEAAVALDRVEDAPDSPARLHVLAEIIDRRAEEDPGFKAELQELIDQARTAGVDMDAVSQIAQGIGIVQIANTQNSTITVSQGGTLPPPGRPKTS